MQRRPPLQQLSLFTRHPTNYQSNLFTTSRQEFTELEKKIVTLMVNQLGNMAVQGKIQPNRNIEILIPFNELTQKHYDQIAEAAESLSKKRISFKSEDSNEFAFITPFPSVKSTLVENRRYIEIKLLSDVVPHFAALGQRYTKYDLDVMLSLSSIYAQRMYEIVSMNMHIKKLKFVYSVEELRYTLNCPASYRFIDFKVNALEVAQRELLSKANIILEFHTARKEGKRVVDLEFEIKSAEKKAEEAVQSDIEKISSFTPAEKMILGFEVMAKYQLKPWQKDHVATNEELLDILLRLHSEFINGTRPEVKNRNKYMAKSLGLDLIKQPKPTSSQVTEPVLNFNTPASQPYTSPVTRSRTVQTIGAVIDGFPKGKK